MALSQSHSWASAVLVDELDADALKSTTNDSKSGSTGFSQSDLDLTNGHNADSGSICQFLLSPVE